MCHARLSMHALKVASRNFCYTFYINWVFRQTFFFRSKKTVPWYSIESKEPFTSSVSTAILQGSARNKLQSQYKAYTYFINKNKTSREYQRYPKHLGINTKEIASLSTSLPLEWDSSIHVQVDSSRMDLLKALIVGPKGTPYQNGVFVFDIYLPPGMTSFWVFILSVFCLFHLICVLLFRLFHIQNPC